MFIQKILKPYTSSHCARTEGLVFMSIMPFSLFITSWGKNKNTKKPSLQKGSPTKGRGSNYTKQCLWKNYKRLRNGNPKWIQWWGTICGDYFAHPHRSHNNAHTLATHKKQSQKSERMKEELPQSYHKYPWVELARIQTSERNNSTKVSQTSPKNVIQVFFPYRQRM